MLNKVPRQGEVKWPLKSDATGCTLSSYLPETVGIANETTHHHDFPAGRMEVPA